MATTTASARSSSPSRLLALRGGLGLLAFGQGSTGAWALLQPRGFYDGFPVAGRHWVSAAGAYDEHLLRDFGALSLALAILLGVAAISLAPALVRTALACWLVWAVPHLAFHAAHVGALAPGDDAADVALLVGSVALPVWLGALAARGRWRR